MHPVPRILVPVDLSDRWWPALEYACALGDASGARVTALHVWEPPSPLWPDALRETPYGSLGLARQDGPGAAHGAIAQLIETALRPDTVAIDTRVETGSPERVILDVARGGNYDLIVMPMRGHSGALHWLAGSTAGVVSRHASCAVIRVPSDVSIAPAAAHAVPPLPSRVLVPYDFSPSADAALDWTVEFGVQSGAAVTLVHVLGMEALGPAPEFSLAPLHGAADDAEHARLQLREVIARRGLVAGIEVLTGPHAGQHIVALASAAAIDLIVMGTQGRTGVARWLHGSVAEYVARYAACPVATIHAPE